jgi:hypothetical protein
VIGKTAENNAAPIRKWGTKELKKLQGSPDTPHPETCHAENAETPFR